MRARTLLAIALVLAAAPSLARAQPSGSDLLARGVELYNDLEYAQAAIALEQALGDPTLSKPQRVEGYKHLALSYLALGRDDDARASFRSLLEADPDFRLPRTESQKALDIFTEVLQAMPRPVDDSPVRLSQSAAPARPRAGNAVQVTVALIDPQQRVKGVQIRHRRKGDKRFSTVTAQTAEAGRYNATISGAFIAQPGLEYYVVAIDEAGEVLASGASEKQPVALVVDAAAEPGKPIYAKWWFWAGVGGVALASIAAGVALAGGTEGDPDATVNVTVEYTP